MLLLEDVRPMIGGCRRVLLDHGAAMLMLMLTMMRARSVHLRLLRRLVVGAMLLLLLLLWMMSMNSGCTGQ